MVETAAEKSQAIKLASKSFLPPGTIPDKSRFETLPPPQSIISKPSKHRISPVPTEPITFLPPEIKPPTGQQLAEKPFALKEIGVSRNGTSFVEKPDVMGKVSIAPTLKESYKTYMADKPFIGGTVSFIGEKIKGFGTQLGLGRAGRYGDFIIGEPYQPEATGRLTEFGAMTGLYAGTGAIGAGIMLGTGAERLVTKKGRAELGLIGTSIKEEYGLPKEFAYAIPALEIGFGGTQLFGSRISGFARTIGRKPIEPTTPSGRVIAPEVEAGYTQFPLAAGDYPKGYPRARVHEIIGMRGEYLPEEYVGKAAGYHAFPTKWGTQIVAPGTSEFKGAYISLKGVSPYFMKVPGGPSVSTSESFIEKWAGRIAASGEIGKPGVMLIETKGFKLGRYAPKGYAFIPGTKAEVEAIIPPSTELISTADRYYYTFRGVRYPVGEFKTVAAGGRPISELRGEFISPSEYAAYKPKVSYTGLGGYGVGYKAYQPKLTYYPSYATSEYISPGVSYKMPSRVSYTGLSYAGLSGLGRGEGYKISDISEIGKGYSKITSGIDFGRGGYYGGRGISTITVIPRFDYGFKTPPIIPPFKMPKLKFKGKKGFGDILGPQPKKYQPSIYATEMGVRAAKMPKLAMTGLTVRPLVSRRRK